MSTYTFPTFTTEDDSIQLERLERSIRKILFERLNFIRYDWHQSEIVVQRWMEKAL